MDGPTPFTERTCVLGVPELTTLPLDLFGVAAALLGVATALLGVAAGAILLEVEAAIGLLGATTGVGGRTGAGTAAEAATGGGMGTGAGAGPGVGTGTAAVEDELAVEDFIISFNGCNDREEEEFDPLLFVVELNVVEISAKGLRTVDRRRSIPLIEA